MQVSERGLTALDYHTEGEPMRIVTDGVPPIPGPTLMARSEHLARHGRGLLGFIIREPRGHAAMCGAIMTSPVDARADAGVLFIEPLGPVHMCGHGAMAVAAMLVETGRVPATGSCTRVTLDTPAGLVPCTVNTAPGHPTSVTIQNVPSFSVRIGAAVDVSGVGPVGYDLAYGGHFYAIVDARSVGVSLLPEQGPRLIELGEAIRRAIEATVPLVHPERPEAPGLLYVQFFDRAHRPEARFRNAVVVAPAGLDRSPCGTGTSARLANLHAQGLLGVGEAFGHESMLGTLFSARIARLTSVVSVPAVIPEITGRAWATARTTLLLDPTDPFPGGFLLTG